MIKFGKGNLRIPRFEKPVYVVAGGLTDYRKKYPEKNTSQLCTEALRMSVEENDLKISPEDFRRRVNWVVYSQFADHFGDQLLAASKIHDYLGFDPLGNIEVKTGGATGGSSVLAAAQAVASGYADCVLIVGWERMDEVSTKVGNSYIASAACKDFESELGWMYAAYYALMAQRYQYENNVPRETLGDQLLAASKIHDYLGFDPLGNIEVKTGGATGGSSVLAAAQAVASGYADCVLIVGWERMDEVSTKVGNSYIASAACKDFESELGWMYAAYYALMAQRYQGVVGGGLTGSSTRNSPIISAINCSRRQKFTTTSASTRSATSR